MTPQQSHALRRLVVLANRLDHECEKAQELLARLDREAQQREEMLELAMVDTRTLIERIQKVYAADKGLD